MNYIRKVFILEIFLVSFLMVNTTYSMDKEAQPPKNFKDLVSSIVTPNEDLNAENAIRGCVDSIEIKGKIKNFTTLAQALTEPNTPKGSDFAYSEFAYLKNNPIGLSSQATKKLLLKGFLRCCSLELLLMGFVYFNEKKITTQNKSGEELGKNFLKNVFKISGNNVKLLDPISRLRSSIKQLSDPDKQEKYVKTHFGILKQDNSFLLNSIDQIFKIIDEWVEFADQEIVKDCKAQRNKEHFFMALKSILVLAAVSGLGFYIFKCNKNQIINIKIYE